MSTKNGCRAGVFLALLLQAFPTSAQFQVGQTLEITMEGGTKTLSVENSVLSDKAPCQLWSQTNTPSQCWQVCENRRGGVSLRNVYTGLFLGGIGKAIHTAPVGQISEAMANVLGSWHFEAVAGKPDTYLLYLGSTKRNCLAAPATFQNGEQLTIHRQQDADPARIQWQVRVVPTPPSALTPEVCTQMMECWKQQYYHPASVGHIIGNGGWWGDAEMFEVVLDALETTGREEYADMFHQLYLNFCHRNGTDWSGNNYNDDIAWMCIACARAYLLTGKVEYRIRAKQNFDKMYKRANAYGDNSLIWCMGKPGTNSCINGPACVAACYLAQCFSDDSYYEKARLTYAAQRSKLYNLNGGRFNGQVYDSYDTEQNKVGNYWSSTYNQGTCLGAACMLYTHFGDQQYRDDADAIMTWTKNNLANADGIIKVCQTVTGDLTGFKGILMRYVRRYAAEMNQPAYYDWLAKNAFHAYNNRNASGISMSAWLTKTPDDFRFHDGGDFSKDGVGAMTALSAAFNAHLGVYRGHRDAFQKHDCSQFDYLCSSFVSTDEDLDTLVGGPLRDGGFLGYRRVQFGEKAPSHLHLQAQFLRSFSTLKVYLDRVGGPLLCEWRCPADSARSWHTLSLPLNTQPTGVHDVFFQVDGFSGSNLLKLHNFCFAHEPATGITTPTTEQTKISVVRGLLHAQCLGHGQLTICDTNGVLVARYALPKGLSSINLSPLRSGVYVAVLQCGKHRSTCRFVQP